ncbi:MULTISPECIES: Wzz/FepE/Etk N-terminal domain-containing protein [unclassified Colwellia]|uniref:Wzz/FepE/Etk N-terminal domain-containing protein n=2 Tax=Colwellia TaxID=28228 RepID=UPI0015F522D8|nr:MULTISPECIES: Wzz/FepE/Etk N-terminal domain-containing protein [unclassified Colwellia]MBA6358068.1 LPS O-antigen length regulator [Colwellia sp. BRX8-3]MBA6368659.1 LPS O-antigen length regulator [Colwellia sp. BRX8-5]MBA6377161.1 LPS O-antigen length regulator [Colwellia sp. BRX8-2]
MENLQVPNQNQSSHNSTQQSTTPFSPEVLLLSQQLAENNNSDEDIDLAELWRAIWSGKYIIIVISFIFAVSSIAFALSKPDIYKASILLAPASSDSAGGMGALAGQFGGLASLAGISLGGGGTDKTALALEIIKSRAFLETFIIKHELLVPLMASENWDRATDSLLINKELYDSKNKKWLREASYPKKSEPSSWEAYQELLKLLSITQDKATSLVTIDVAFYSPEVAKQWLIWLVEDVNDFMREKDEKEAQSSIDYLTKQLENTEVSAMETVFYQLIEEQTKNMMLTKVSAEYVLKTIDPAQVPEKKSGPKRALIVVLGTMLGGILSVLIVLIRHFTKNNKSTKPKDENLA